MRSPRLGWTHHKGYDRGEKSTARSSGGDDCYPTSKKEEISECKHENDDLDSNGACRRCLVQPRRVVSDRGVEIEALRARVEELEGRVEDMRKLLIAWKSVNTQDDAVHWESEMEQILEGKE